MSFFLNYLVSVIFIGQGSGNLKWRMILQCLYRLFSFKGFQYFCCWSLLFYLMFYFQKQLVFLLYLEFVLEKLQERKLLLVSVVNMNGSWKSEYARIWSDENTFLKFSKRFLILFMLWIFDWILFSAFWKRFREVGIIFDKSTVVSRKIKKLFNFFLCGGYLPVMYFCFFFVGYAKISFCFYLFVLAIYLATFGFIIIILPFHVTHLCTQRCIFVRSIYVHRFWYLVWSRETLLRSYPCWFVIIRFILIDMVVSFLILIRLFFEIFIMSYRILFLCFIFAQKCIGVLCVLWSCCLCMTKIGFM